LLIQCIGQIARGNPTRTYEAKGGVVYADTLTFAPSEVTGEGPALTGLEVARQAHAAGWRGSLLIMSDRTANIEEPLDHPLLRLILAKPFPTRELVDAMPQLDPRPPS
jgi:hypothetical protein